MICFDIESVPTDAALTAPYPEEDRPAPGNYKDPAKIEEWRERDKAKWQDERVKECSLNPREGRIVAVGIGRTDPGSLLAPTEAEEASLVAEVWERITVADGKIVTFNGQGFDVPFFLTRSLILRVTPQLPLAIVRNWQRRYSYSPHYDVRSVLTNWDSRSSGTLTDWCKALGIECSNDTKGSDIYELYQKKDFKGIAAHARSDVGLTMKLYERVSSVYGGMGA